MRLVYLYGHRPSLTYEFPIISHIEDLSPANDDRLLPKAIEWKMKIWTVAKLESVLDRCQAPVNTELSKAASTTAVPQTLSRLLQSERLHGTTERDPNEKRLGLHYFSKNSYFLLVEDLNDEVATIHAAEYPIKKGRDGKEYGDWPILHCHPRARGPFIEFDKNEARRAERAARQEKARERERAQRVTKLREQEMQKKMRADRLQAKRAGDLRRSVSMVNLHRRVSIGEDGRPPQDVIDLDAEAGDITESANASGYLASGYMAASGNSITITSTAGTTSTSGLSARQMAPALRERLQQQIVTSRKVGLGNNTGQKESEKDYKGDMGPPSAIPERRLLRKSKSTNTMKLPKREETTKPGYCECCRMKFDDFQKVRIYDACDGVKLAMEPNLTRLCSTLYNANIGNMPRTLTTSSNWTICSIEYDERLGRGSLQTDFVLWICGHLVTSRLMTACGTLSRFLKTTRRLFPQVRKCLTTCHSPTRTRRGMNWMILLLQTVNNTQTSRICKAYPIETLSNRTRTLVQRPKHCIPHLYTTNHLHSLRYRNTHCSSPTNNATHACAPKQTTEINFMDTCDGVP